MPTLSRAFCASCLLVGLSATMRAQLPRLVELTGTGLPPDKLTGSSVVCGDLNGDGTLDLVVGTTAMQMGSQNRVYFGDGDGHFADVTAWSLPQVQDPTTSLALGDVDGDGDLDLVVGNRKVVQGSDRNRLYLNDGNGKFQDVTSTYLPKHEDATNGLLFADLDGDRDLDLLVANAPLASGNDRLYLNNGKGRFRVSPQPLPVGFNTQQHVTGDVDGDGDLDIVAVGSHAARLYINGGRGVFKEESQGRMPSQPLASVAAGMVDVDGDRDLDLVIGGRSSLKNPDRLYLNDGRGWFSDASANRLPRLEADTAWITCGDIDLDGDQDLLLAGLGKPVRLYLNDGRGSFADSPMPQHSFLLPRTVLGDVDTDGDLDLVSVDGHWFRVERPTVYFSLHRQLHQAAPPKRGQDWHLYVFATPGYGQKPEVAIGFVSLGRMPTRVRLPPFGLFSLDPATLVPLPAIPIPESGIAALPVPVPNHPILAGRPVAAQALIVHSQYRLDWRFSNVWVDRIQ